MPSQLSPVAAIVLLLVTVGLIWINRKRDTWAILETRFRTASAPDGPPVECELRFPLAEVSTPCVAQASQAGLYLISTKEQIAKWRWVAGVPFLRHQVFIPRSQLDYRCAKFPMRKWLRFDIHDTEACFFVRQSVAAELLRTAGRSLPTRR